MSEPRPKNPVTLGGRKPTNSKPLPSESNGEQEPRKMVPVYGITRGEDTVVDDTEVVFRDFSPRAIEEEDEEVSAPKAESASAPASSGDSEPELPKTAAEPSATPTEASPKSSVPVPPAIPAPSPVVEEVSPKKESDEASLPDSSSIKKIG